MHDSGSLQDFLVGHDSGSLQDFLVGHDSGSLQDFLVVHDSGSLQDFLSVHDYELLLEHESFSLKLQAGTWLGKMHVPLYKAQPL